MDFVMPDDPFVLELLPEFVDTWITDMDEVYDNYVETENETELYRLAHTLKGSCLQFGINNIGNMGIELMAIARAHDWEKAKEYGVILKLSFKEIKNYLDNLQT